MLLNRTYELETLNNEYQKTTSAMSIIYGQRGIGKTSLIREFLKDKSHIYFYVSSSDLKQQYNQLFKQVLDLFPTRAKFETFEEILGYLIESTKNEKIVFVIDNFQNLCFLDKTFPSKLQNFWDLTLQNANIHFIISGSSTSTIHFEVLDKIGPLHGKITSTISLQTFQFKYIAKLLPNVSLLDQMNIFGSLGTNPKYLHMYDHDLDLMQNIKKNILYKDSYLYREGELLLKLDLKELGTYYGIIEAISRGNNKVGAIALALGVHSSYLSQYLQNLVDVQILDKEVPITESDPKRSKMGRYKIKDKFLDFWFYYVYKNYRLLELGKVEEVINEISSTFNNRFVSFAFKDYIKEKIMSDPERYLGFRPQKIGRWWNNKEEIDLVAFNDTHIAYIECKWQNNVNKKYIENALIGKSKQIEKEKRKESYLVFTKEDYLNVN